jgi:hypothetical protein
MRGVTHDARESIAKRKAELETGADFAAGLAIAVLIGLTLALAVSTIA